MASKTANSNLYKLVSEEIAPRLHLLAKVSDIYSEVPYFGAMVAAITVTTFPNDLTNNYGC